MRKIDAIKLMGGSRLVDNNTISNVKHLALLLFLSWSCVYSFPWSK